MREIAERSGIQVLVYLTFEKYTARFFWVLALVPGLPLLATYLAISYTEGGNLGFYQNQSGLYRVTISSYRCRSGQDSDAFDIFYFILLMQIVLVFFGHAHIYLFKQKCNEIKLQF